MSRGLMLFALDERVFASFDAPVAVDAFLFLAQDIGTRLSNASHMPADYDAMLQLDKVLEEQGYPKAFRYGTLLHSGVPAEIFGIEDYPQLGFISARETARAAECPRQWLARLADDSAAVMLEELLQGADQAAALGRGLLGIYS